MSDALRNVNPIRDRGACVLVILTNIQAARHCVRGVVSNFKVHRVYGKSTCRLTFLLPPPSFKPVLLFFVTYLLLFLKHPQTSLFFLTQ